MITYEIKVEVYLDNLYVGYIGKDFGGYRYFPKGQKEGGQVFETIEKVKKSLEAD